jgi:hypothetical protein
MQSLRAIGQVTDYVSALGSRSRHTVDVVRISATLVLVKNDTCTPFVNGTVAIEILAKGAHAR